MSLGALRSPGSPAVAPVPPATRAGRAGWRDPRLWVGILIVAVSVVAGARLLAAADDSVAVWAVASDAGPGARLTADDLVVHRVRFADADDLGRYFAVDDDLPADLRLVRPVSAGELLPRAALGAAGATADTVELPISVDTDQVPPSVGSGSVVDVYLLDPRGRHGPTVTTPALARATVVDAGGADATFAGGTGRRQLVLAVPEAAAAAFLDALGRADDPVLTVVRRG